MKKISKPKYFMIRKIRNGYPEKVLYLLSIYCYTEDLKNIIEGDYSTIPYKNDNRRIEEIEKPYFETLSSFGIPITDIDRTVYLWNRKKYTDKD
jgi:hypothetical protein